MGEMARIIRNGDSQSVELPEGFRFEGEEVRISRDGDQIVLEPAEDAYDLDAVDESTGLTIRELRALIAEGEQGPFEPWDVEELKRDLEAYLEADRAQR